MKMQNMFVLSLAIAATGLAYAGDITKIDTNGDGQVSLSEYTASGKTQADFNRLDANRDGIATSAELTAHMGTQTEGSYDNSYSQPTTDIGTQTDVNGTTNINSDTNSATDSTTDSANQLKDDMAPTDTTEGQ